MYSNQKYRKMIIKLKKNPIIGCCIALLMWCICILPIHYLDITNWSKFVMAITLLISMIVALICFYGGKSQN